MKLRIPALLILALSILFISCKTDKEEPVQQEQAVEETVEKKPVRTIEDIKKAKSVMAKLMLTKECSRFSSYLVTVGLTDKLFLEDGPFTVFAPTDDVIERLGDKLNKGLSQQQKQDSLAIMLKGHIVEGYYDTVNLVQALKSGPVKLTTLNGSGLTISKKGSEIMVESEKGISAKIGKSDIIGGNGVIHLIDNFLGSN